jgi:hypothetical protein
MEVEEDAVFLQIFLLFNRNAPSYYRVVAGTLKTASPGSTHTVTKITSNAWNSATNLNDISIWKISPAFTFNSNTKAVGLPAQGTTSAAGTVMTVSGWGTTSVSYFVNTDLKENKFLNLEFCGRNIRKKLSFFTYYKTSNNS